jgi:hypothetical protein
MAFSTPIPYNSTHTYNPPQPTMSLENLPITRVESTEWTAWDDIKLYLSKWYVILALCALGVLIIIGIVLISWKWCHCCGLRKKKPKAADIEMGNVRSRAADIEMGNVISSRAADIEMGNVSSRAPAESARDVLARMMGERRLVA